MVEIILLWIFCKRIAAISRSRGREPRDDCVVLVGLWILGEFLGIIIGELITGSFTVVGYGLALAGAVAGCTIAFRIARQRPYRFTAAQFEGIRAICDTFAEVDDHPFEQRVNDLQREISPEREIEKWERMGRAYRSYCEKNSPLLEAKKEIYRLVLLRSMMPEQAAIEQVQLRTLSLAEAEEVMRGWSNQGNGQ
jgi:hypothetical protein